MRTKLMDCFPLIRTENEILEEINGKKELSNLFLQWSEEQRQEFLDWMTGVKGVRLLYDSFFKEIMNPEYYPERLNDFLSLLLKREVKILVVLPNDSTRIAEESSLLIMDIVVELGDGSLANVEVQKIGYHFPGQRCACYSSDLLLRQYKRIRSEKKKKFSYKEIRDVYTIVLFEKSPGEFHQFPTEYRHAFSQRSNTGLELDLLQKYVFIPLDIFRENQQNKPIKNKLDAWLVFLCMDEPEMIIKLITDWAEFKPMYEQVYEICRNVERVMEMFSKELQELDRNTVQYMIDEMQDEINEQRAQLEEQKRLLQMSLEEKEQLLRCIEELEGTKR